VVTDNPKQPVTNNKTQQDDSANSKPEAGSGQVHLHRRAQRKIL